MILYGRDLSPFVRRIAIWCDLQERPIERRKLMVSGPEWEQVKAVNPTGRVPALVLPDGEVLVESWAIMDWLEETAAPHLRLLPEKGAARRHALQMMAHAHSASEKAVTLVYERTRRPEEFHWPDYLARIEGQVTAALDVVEAMMPDEGWCSGTDQPHGPDIAAVIAIDFVVNQHLHLVEGRYPKLHRLTEASHAIPAFAKTRPGA